MTEFPPLPPASETAMAVTPPSQRPDHASRSLGCLDPDLAATWHRERRRLLPRTTVHPAKGPVQPESS